MAPAYWTHCMYCGGMICGVEVLPDYPDVVVLYAHTACHVREGCRMYYDQDLNPIARIL